MTDPLDLNVDLTTFALSGIFVAGQALTPIPGQSDFSTTLDLRPANDLLLSVKSHLDQTARQLTLTFQSLDPSTRQPPTDPTTGFLPPGAGASFFFTVMPKAGIGTGTQVSNQATVIFDYNPPIPTAVWTNTIDDTPPTSRVSPLQTSQTASSFAVSWSGTDQGSGVQDYTVYVSDNGGTFVPWLSNVGQTSALYHGTPGHAYAFWTTARDFTENEEPAKAAGDTATTVAQVPSCAANFSDQIAVVQSGYRYNNAAKQFVQTVTLINTGSEVTGLLSLVLDSLPQGVSLASASGVTSCSVPAGSPYVNVALGSSNGLAIGQSVQATIQFNDPTMAAITYMPRVIAGSQGR